MVNFRIVPLAGELEGVVHRFGRGFAVVMAAEGGIGIAVGDGDVFVDIVIIDHQPHTAQPVMHIELNIIDIRVGRPYGS